MSTLYVNTVGIVNTNAVDTNSGNISKAYFSGATRFFSFVDSDNFLWGLSATGGDCAIVKFDASRNIVFSKTLTGISLTQFNVMCPFTSGSILFAVRTGAGKEIRKLDSSGNMTVYTPASALSAISANYCVGLTVASNGKVFAAFNTNTIYEITNSGATISSWKQVAGQSFSKLATNNGDVFALNNYGIYRFSSNKTQIGIAYLSGYYIIDFVFGQSSNIYAATRDPSDSTFQYVYKLTGAQGVVYGTPYTPEIVAYSKIPGLITDGYYSFGYYVSGNKTSASIVERAVDNNLYYVYAGTVATVANGIYTIDTDTSYHSFSNGTDNGIVDGYAPVGSVWHHFTSGTDDGPVTTGYQYNVTGDGLWHHFTSGTDDGLVQGLHNDVTGDSLWYLFTDGVGTQLEDGYHNIGGVWYSLSGGVGGLVTGYHNDVTGDSLWYLFTAGSGAILNGAHDSVTDSYWHTFSDGSDLGIANGYAQVGSIWHHFTSGTDDGLVQGYHNDVTGDSLWHHFTSGTDDGVVDGYQYNVTGDGLWHHFTSGTDDGAFTGYAAIAGVWHHFTSGGDDGLVQGYHNDVIPGGEWYLFTDGVPSGPIEGYSPDGGGSGNAPSSGGDDGGGSGNAPSSGGDNGNAPSSGGDNGSFTGYTQVGAVWHHFTSGADDGPLTGYHDNATGDGLWHSFDAGVMSGTPDGYAQVGSVWYSFTSGTNNGPVTGYHNDVTGNGLWYSFTSGTNNGPVTGYQNNITGDGSWHSFSNGTDNGVAPEHYELVGGAMHSVVGGEDRGAIEGYKYNVFADGLWNNFIGGSNVGAVQGYLNTVTGDGLWHIFTGGSDGGLVNGFAQVGTVWHQFTGGTDSGPVNGDRKDVYGDDIYHHWVNGVDFGHITGDRDDVIPGGLWYRFTAGQPAILDGLVNFKLSFVWHIFDNGTDLGPVHGWYSIGGAACQGIYHIYDHGRDMGTVDGYKEYIGPDVGGCSCWGNWHLWVGGMSIMALKGYYFNIGGSGLWQYFDCGKLVGNADGYHNDVTGDGLWWRFQDGVLLGIVNGVNCEVFVDGNCGDALRSEWPGNNGPPDDPVEPDENGKFPPPEPCGVCHLFFNGADLGPLHGYYPILGSWRKWRRGRFVEIVTGCHEDNVLGNNTVDCFDSGGNLIQGNTHRDPGYYFEYGLWYYYTANGTGTPIDGNHYNLTGDEQTHYYYGGVDGGVVE